MIPYFTERRQSRGQQKWIFGSLHTVKSFRNHTKSTRNQIVFTIFRLIWNLTDVRLVPNHSGNGKYNLILIRFNNISKIFPCVRGRAQWYTNLYYFYFEGKIYGDDTPHRVLNAIKYKNEAMESISFSSSYHWKHHHHILFIGKMKQKPLKTAFPDISEAIWAINLKQEQKVLQIVEVDPISFAE